MNRRQFAKTTLKSVALTTIAFSAMGLNSCTRPTSGTGGLSTGDISPYWGDASFDLSGTGYSLSFELISGDELTKRLYYKVCNTGTDPFTWGDTTIAPGSCINVWISYDGTLSL